VRAVVTLPTDPTDPSSRCSGRSCAEIPVLLIEGDDAFRGALRELLQDDGHPVQAYRSANELPPFPELSPSSMLITAYELDGTDNGLTLARRVNAVHPAARIMIVTTYASHQLERSAASTRFVSLLHKPVRYEQLHDWVHERA
jgi:DNA-binding NtrC family response regulator